MAYPSLGLTLQSPSAGGLFTLKNIMFLESAPSPFVALRPMTKLSKNSFPSGYLKKSVDRTVSWLVLPLVKKGLASASVSSYVKIYKGKRVGLITPKAIFSDIMQDI